jgi:importin subunit alpha-6/7
MQYHVMAPSGIPLPPSFLFVCVTSHPNQPSPITVHSPLLCRLFVPALAALLHSDDKDVLQDALWGLSYITDGDDDRIQTVLDSGIVGKIVSLLGHESNGVVVPALRTAGNIVTGSDHQTQAVINAGIAQHLVRLMKSERRNVRREATWAVSNIAAGTPPQVAGLVSYPGIVQGIVELLAGAEWNVRKEAAWAVSNLCSSPTAVLVDALVANGVLAPLVEACKVEDNRIALVMLEAVTAILQQGVENVEAGRAEDFCQKFEEAGGVDTLEELQMHANTDIYSKAVGIIEKFYGVEEDDDENAAPAVGTSEGGLKTFSFGVAASAPSTDAGSLGALLSAASGAQPLGSSVGGMGGIFGM